MISYFVVLKQLSKFYMNVLHNTYDRFEKVSSLPLAFCNYDKDIIALNETSQCLRDLFGLFYY